MEAVSTSHLQFDDISEGNVSNASSISPTAHSQSLNVNLSVLTSQPSTSNYLRGSISLDSQPAASLNPINNDDEIVQLPDIEYPIIEPIVIRGEGNITLFGLSNMFNSDFPSMLIGRISKEEFQASIAKINNLLRDHHNTNVKLMLLGCLCCCCSFGCSLLWPTLALSKRTRCCLEKLLSEENERLYHKLGFNWKLSKKACHNNSAFMEYVILIEFLPKLQMYYPD